LRVETGDNPITEILLDAHLILVPRMVPSRRSPASPPLAFDADKLKFKCLFWWAV